MSESARKILAWLVCAMRPFKWREIQCAVSIDPNAGEHNYGMRFAQGPKDICGSLVELQADGSLLLVHQTAKTFVTHHECTLEIMLTSFSYLLSAEVIFERPEHLQLSKLCLEQFCFAAFDESMPYDDLVTHVQAGDFAFFEYSVTNWVSHLTSSFWHDGPECAIDASERDIDDFAEVLGICLDIHWIEPSAKSKFPTSAAKIVKGLPKLQHNLKTQLLRTIASVRSLTSTDLATPLQFETLKVYALLRTVRQILERLVSEPYARIAIEEHYGKSVFKCPRLYCQWFFEGFGTAALRDDHVTRHERAHYCPYLDCERATLGCTTAKELEDHLEGYHEQLITDDDSPSPLQSPKPAYSKPAPQLNSPAAGSAIHSPPATNTLTTKAPKKKRVRNPGPFPCKSCTSVFTVSSRLRSHMRIHTNEKPWICAICQKAFARSPDLTRHKRVHVGEGMFACRGRLVNGIAWGCGKTFRRADGLARHYKGDKGKLCMKPLVDEQETRRQQNATTSAGPPLNSSNAASHTIPSHLTLPQQHLGYMSPSVSSTTNTGSMQLPPTTQTTYAAFPGYSMFDSDQPLPVGLYEQYQTFRGSIGMLYLQNCHNQTNQASPTSVLNGLFFSAGMQRQHRRAIEVLVSAF